MDIRYYKGKNKLERITKKDSMGKALYRALEDGPFWKEGGLIVIPVRLCYINRKGGILR